MHMVPSTDQIKIALSDIGVGSIVRFNSKLISINHPDGYRWSSSLTRVDQDDGACELFNIESVNVTQN
ncbi:MAG: hypothetical protein ACI854_001148 [Arenicella sp.]|jgi:hypothetical protein